MPMGRDGAVERRCLANKQRQPDSCEKNDVNHGLTSTCGALASAQNYQGRCLLGFTMAPWLTRMHNTRICIRGNGNCHVPKRVQNELEENGLLQKRDKQTGFVRSGTQVSKDCAQCGTIQQRGNLHTPHDEDSTDCRLEADRRGRCRSRDFPNGGGLLHDSRRNARTSSTWERMVSCRLDTWQGAENEKYKWAPTHGEHCGQAWTGRVERNGVEGVRWRHEEREVVQSSGSGGGPY